MIKFIHFSSYRDNYNLISGISNTIKYNRSLSKKYEIISLYKWFKKNQKCLCQTKRSQL